MTRVLVWTGAVLALAAQAGDRQRRLPTPAEVGFHHCALIYEKASRTASDFAPYVARGVAGTPREWLFDAFLFLRFAAPSGVRTDDGMTTFADWRAQLDEWFAPGRDLRALDDAIERASQALGKPPAPRQVVLTIAYPNPGARAFGPLPDGSTVDLSDEAGMLRAVGWYVGETERRFEAAAFRHLKLWGFYWMREEAPPADVPRIAVVARMLHGRGHRFTWIPWWRASGFDRWRECGFDVAFLQPNYAFHSWTHGGSVRRNRLAAAYDLAREHGLGMEMEAGGLILSAADRRAFLHYLADGSRLGYQKSAMAYFLSTDSVGQTSRSRDPAIARMYTALADYVTGRPVADPDPPLRTRRTAEGLLAVLPPGAGASGVDVLFDEPATGLPWAGYIEVLSRRDRAGVWLPVGWAIRSGRDAAAGKRQVVTVPGSIASGELLVKLVSMRGAAPREVRIVPDRLTTEAPIAHSALGRPYRADGPARRPYDDDGTKLTDGVVPEGGFGDGRSVGWTAPTAAVQFDLGSVRNVTRIEVACQGGSAAAVNWPAASAAMLSRSGAPPAALAGRGGLPIGFRWLTGSAPIITRRRSPTDMDGAIAFEAKPPAQARYVTLVFQSQGWLMLSEVRILSGSTNIAQVQGARYALRPLPTPSDASVLAYVDDAVRLTDGVVARTFNRAQVTGWMDGDEHAVTVDLESPTRISGVVAWSLRGGLHGIYAPREVAVEVSQDGANWKPLGAAARPPGEEDGKECVAAKFVLQADRAVVARHVRVRIRRDRGWAMLSEIEVIRAR